MAHKPHPMLRVGAFKGPEVPLFTSDPNYKNWLKGQAESMDVRSARALAKEEASAKARSTVYDADTQALWRMVKADRLKFPQHKPGFTSCAQLVAHLGPRPQGAVLRKADSKEPYSAGNAYWGNDKGQPLTPISEASRKAHAALRRALKSVPELPPNLYRVKGTGGRTREQSQALYEIETKTRLLKPVPALPDKPKLSPWEELQRIKRLTRDDDEKQVALLLQMFT